MNLIERSVRESLLTSYRSIQYAKIPELLLTGINYLIDLGMEYDPNFYNKTAASLKFEIDETYQNIACYDSYFIETNVNDYKHPFFKMSIPNLIQGIFFNLNSTLYVPMVYIMDEPIVIKPESIVAQSLFQPITLYFKEHRLIFMKMSIHLDSFLELMTYDWDPEAKKLMKEVLNINFDNSNINTTLNNLSEKLNTNKDIESIRNKLNLLFFDDWTKQVYQRIYNFEPTIDNILRHALWKKIQYDRDDIITHFTDLRYKRLMFTEILLRPYFKAISEVSKKIINGNTTINFLNLKLNCIITHFFDELKGYALYDTTNGYSSILASKASFKNPYSESRLPSEVSSIHWTHKGRLCPNSISNKSPGESVALVPDQEIDLDFGLFKFSDDEKEI